jgi:hypothetical protein
VVVALSLATTRRAAAVCDAIVVVDQGLSAERPELGASHNLIGATFDAAWNKMRDPSVCYARYYALSRERQFDRLLNLLGSIPAASATTGVTWRTAIADSNIPITTTWAFVTVSDEPQSIGSPQAIKSGTGVAAGFRVCEVDGPTRTLRCDVDQPSAMNLAKAADARLWRFLTNKARLTFDPPSRTVVRFEAVSCGLTAGGVAEWCRATDASVALLLDQTPIEELPALITEGTRDALHAGSIFAAFGLEGQAKAMCVPSAGDDSYEHTAANLVHSGRKIESCPIEFSWPAEAFGEPLRLRAAFAGCKWSYSRAATTNPSQRFSPDTHWFVIPQPNILSSISFSDRAAVPLSAHVWALPLTSPDSVEVVAKFGLGQNSVRVGFACSKPGGLCSFLQSASAYTEVPIETRHNETSCICLKEAAKRRLPAFWFKKKDDTNYYFGWSQFGIRLTPVPERPTDSCEPVGSNAYKCTGPIGSAVTDGIPLCAADVNCD